MSTQSAALGAALAALLIATADYAQGDEIEATEVIVAEERIEPPTPAANTAPPAEEPCCTVPPLQYLDRGVAAGQSWLSGINEKLSLHSGLSSAFQWDLNDPPNGKVPYRFMTNGRSYDLELFQIALGYDVDPAPGGFGANVVFDAGRIARRMKADWNGSGVIPDDSWEDKSVELQSAYLQYNVPIGNGVTLKGGKFVTVLGSESIEPWANPTFSRSYIFTYGSPYTGTGGTISYPATKMITLMAGGIIGWNEVADNNNRPSAIGQIALTPSPYVDLTMSGMVGPEQSCAGKPGALPTLQGANCNSNLRGVVDVVLDVRPRDDLSLVLDFNWGSESQASQLNPGRHGEWIGIAGTVEYDITDCISVATRGEWFQDMQGVRLPAVAPGPTDQPEPVGATVWAITLDARAQLSEFIYLRGEYRYDGSPQAIFDATTSFGADSYWKGQNTFALELGYDF